MKILRRVLVVLVGLLVLWTAIGLLLPARAHVERSLDMAATPATVFGIVNGFQRFNEWSPWRRYDPAATYTYSGPESGVGARFAWSSQKPEVGSGWQEIVASEPVGRVAMLMDFSGQAQVESQFTIVPNGEGSRVTWSLDADFGYDLLERYVGLLFDRMIGPDYEAGLVNLRTLAENEATSVAARRQIAITVENVPAADLVTSEGVASLDPASIEKGLADAFDRIDTFLDRYKLERAGPRLAITRFYDESGWGFEAAVPVSGSAETLAAARRANGGPAKVSAGYVGRAIRGVHVGARADLPDTYRLIEDYAAENGLEPNGRAWEQYVSDAGSAPAEPRTDVFVPVKATATR